MKEICWDAQKNELLKVKRGVSFEQVLAQIRAGEVLEILDNPGKGYQHQRIFVLEINQYVYYIPFVESESTLFLKTIIPSRKLTKRYKNEQKNFPTTYA